MFKKIQVLILGSISLGLIGAPAFAGDGSPPPNYINVIVNTPQNPVPEISVPPTVKDPNTRLALPPCVGAIKNDCISSVEYSSGNGKWISATFFEPMELKNLTRDLSVDTSDFNELGNLVFAKAIPEINFPEGGRTGLWQMDGAKHAGGNLYAATVSFSGEVADRSNPRSSTSKINWNNDLRISIGTYTPVTASMIANCQAAFLSMRFNCESLNRDRFPAKTKYRLTVNFLKTKSILDQTPWLIGHIYNSKIFSSSNPDGSTTVVIEGTPSIHGLAMAKINKTEANYAPFKKALEVLDSVYLGIKDNLDYSYERFLQDPGNIGIGTVTPGVVETWAAVEKIAPFNYQSESDIWLVEKSRIAPDDQQILNKCNYKSLKTGLVATNALGANSRPPTWDSAAKELVYSVASPHLRMSGSLNEGIYEISVDEKMVECLWGKDASKYRAELKVTSLEGVNKVTAIKVATRNQMMTFQAAGFTYSANKIELKLMPSTTGVASVEDLPDYFPDENRKEIPTATSATKTSSPVTTKKKSIVCAKGKLKKTVTAIFPTCPTGYKMVK